MRVDTFVLFKVRGVTDLVVHHVVYWHELFRYAQCAASGNMDNHQYWILATASPALPSYGQLHQHYKRTVLELKNIKIQEKKMNAVVFIPFFIMSLSP